MNKKSHKPTELIVALDFPSPKQALMFVEKLKGFPVIYKVGSELFVTGGPEFVSQMVSKGHRVFLDLKFHDIPNTVAKAAHRAAILGVEMFSVHLAGGKAVFDTVRTELANLPAPHPKVVGISVLTSFGEEAWAEVTQALSGAVSTPSASVERLIEKAIEWNVDSLVCSPHELAVVRALSKKIFTIVPGIRPAGSPKHDQVRVMTPEEARDAGANAIVMGRPITLAKDPVQVVLSLLELLGTRVK